MVRPGVEEYLKRMGELYEVVIYTASLSDYANPVIDAIDPSKVISHRLYREHCTYYNGIYVKDLSRVGRDLKNMIIVDNSPNSFLFHPNNAVLIKNYFDDDEDRELEILTPFFELMARMTDVRPTENWRVKFYEGELEKYVGAKMDKLISAGPISEVKNPDDSSETLSKTKDWAETDDDSSVQESRQTNSYMALPSILKEPKRADYNKVPNSPNNDTPTKLLASEDDLVDTFTPKTDKRNQNRKSSTDEHEKLKQLEMENEEDVEDRKKIEEARFLNTSMNIQSPVHHKLDDHFEFPPTSDETSGILPPPVKKITGNALYRPVEQFGEEDAQE
jgi:Dullard-like phosphatase family protein